MARNSKYHYLNELERSQQLDRINTMEGGERNSQSGANRRNIQRERERLRKEQERIRRVKILRRVLIAALIGVVVLIVIVIGGIFGNKKPGGGVTPLSDVTPTPTGAAGDISEAPIPSVFVTAAAPTETPTPSPTPTPEPVFAWWEYISEEPMPVGDIVSVTSDLYTYEQMCRDLNFLRERYSGKVQVYRIGRTADGRDLLDAVVGSENASKDLIIQYSMHAREYINTPLAMRQLEEFLKGWDSQSYNGRSYGSLVQDVRLHILPMANPDGVSISQSGFEAIRSESLRSALNDIWQYDISIDHGSTDYRTYYRRWKANGRGVDLNRNFDQNWETTGGTPWYSSSGFRGESAASENETQAIVRLADEINCIGEIAYHSMGQVIYWDYGTTGELQAKDEKLATLVEGLTGYALNSTIDTGQNSSGCSDYFMLVRGVPAITIETGKETCPVPFEQWPDLWERNRYILPALAELFAGF